MTKLTNLPLSERPRERLVLKGPQALRDEELLAVLLGSGTRSANVLSLAGKVLSVVDERNGRLSIDDLRKIKGMGLAKAALITAAFEFARRRIRPEGVRIQSAREVVPLVQHYADRKQEHFISLSLNGGHEVIATRVVTIGLVNASQVHPREVFAEPLLDRACAIIVAHNHPSGDVTPSKEDIAVTRRLEKAAETLGLTLLDHIIFSKNGFFSFSEQRLVL